jgi:hypothetical protein
MSKPKYIPPPNRKQRRRNNQRFQKALKKMLKKKKPKEITDPELRLSPEDLQVGDIISVTQTNPDTPISKLDGDMIRRLPVGTKLKYLGNKQNKYTKTLWKYFELKDEKSETYFGIIKPAALYGNIGYNKDEQEW